MGLFERPVKTNLAGSLFVLDAYIVKHDKRRQSMGNDAAIFAEQTERVALQEKVRIEYVRIWCKACCWARVPIRIKRM